MTEGRGRGVMAEKHIVVDKDSPVHQWKDDTNEGEVLEGMRLET